MHTLQLHLPRTRMGRHLPQRNHHLPLTQWTIPRTVPMTSRATILTGPHAGQILTPPQQTQDPLTLYKNNIPTTYTKLPEHLGNYYVPQDAGRIVSLSTTDTITLNDIHSYVQHTHPHLRIAPETLVITKTYYSHTDTHTTLIQVYAEPCTPDLPTDPGYYYDNRKVLWRVSPDGSMDTVDLTTYTPEEHAHRYTSYTKVTLST